MRLSSAEPMAAKLSRSMSCADVATAHSTKASSLRVHEPRAGMNMVHLSIICGSIMPSFGRGWGGVGYIGM